MPVIFFPTPPFFLAIPRRAMEFPVSAPLPQISHRRITKPPVKGAHYTPFSCKWIGAIIYSISTLSHGGHPQSKAMKKLKRKVIFEYYAPMARRVHVAGTFNNWNLEACALRKDRSGKWKTALSLPPGRYEYRYLVDGIWENDQRPVECVPNAFGSWNCVVTVQ